MFSDILISPRSAVVSLEEFSDFRYVFLLQFDVCSQIDFLRYLLFPVFVCVILYKIDIMVVYVEDGYSTNTAKDFNVLLKDLRFGKNSGY